MAQGAAEILTATATVKSAAGAAASAPITITIDRKMSQTEADSVVAAFKTGGAAGLRKALAGGKPTGTVKIGAQTATPTRFTIERVTSDGRLLTILTDRPLLFLGASLPGAKAKEGYSLPSSTFSSMRKATGRGRSPPQQRSA